jgi:hypothetical protein
MDVNGLIPYEDKTRPQGNDLDPADGVSSKKVSNPNPRKDGGRTAALRCKNEKTNLIFSNPISTKRLVANGKPWSAAFAIAAKYCALKVMGLL